MNFFIERLVDGLSLGTIYGLLGVACSLCWRINRSLTLAIAACCVIGVAVSLATISAAAGFGPRLAPVSLLIGTLAATGAASVTGFAIRKGITCRASDFSPLPLTASAGLLLIALAALQFSAQLRMPAVLNPSFAPGLVFTVPGFFDFAIPTARLVTIVPGAVLIPVVWWLFDRSRFGRTQLAAAEDPQLAELFGIPIHRLMSISALICFGVAGCAGSMIVIQGPVTDGNSVLLTTATAFVAGALAGLRSVGRAAAGGVAAGVVVALWSGYFSPSYAGAAAFAVLLFLLIVTPAQPLVRAASEAL